VALLDAKASVLDAYCSQTKQPRVQPIFFVVAQTIDEASEIRDLLAGPDFLNGEEKVLLVTSEEPDKTLALLDTLEEPGSPIRAVVSVSMLKEGWDVKNIYVIAAVRAMESQLLTEQILGRGLRLPFGARTGVPMLDTVEVLSHHSFAELLREAHVLLKQTLRQRADEATVVVDPTPGVRRDGVPLDTDTPQLAASEASSVIVELPGHALEVGEGEDQGSLFDVTPTQTHVGMGLSTVDAVLQSAEQARETLATRLTPRTPGGIKMPLFLPRVTTRWEREPFSLSLINTIDAEALGRLFADDEGATLTRKALDAQRGDDGDVRVVIHDETDQVLASQQRIPFDSIEDDLARRLLMTDGIEATLDEKNAAIAIARAFLQGADVTKETPWRAEHGQLATNRLVQWINEQRTSKPAREVKEVTQVRWPDPPERTETRTPADRHLITSSKEFVRGYPYTGWERSVYVNVSFDAYSTEFRLASLFDTTPGIRAWARVYETVPLRITYLQGAIQREYEPDFIVIDETGTQWIVEGKADSEMTNPIVVAKADAAKQWVATVNASSSVHQQWGYILASESAIAASSTWAALKAGAHTYT